MDSKEKVATTLAHQEPDRVPVDYWATPEITERLVRELPVDDKEGLLRTFGVDLRYIEGPSYQGQEMQTHPDGTTSDLWGVRRRTVKVERDGFTWQYKHVEESPLAGMASAREIDRYEGWPSPDWWDYSRIADDCRRHSGYAVVNVGDRLDRTAQLKPAMYLRGMEQIYIDLIESPAIVEAILAHITEYFLGYNRRVFEAAEGGIDIFMMGDDFGTQQGLMMDLDTWRRYFGPGFRAYIELAHRYGIKVMHHTCGGVRELIPELIDAGLDILQSIQPRATGMDLAELKREYGRHICFHGSLDIQRTLPKGTPAEVREEVRQRMAAGKPGGGFIICTAHNIQPDTPTENVVALFEACREFGGY